jgi:transketolase N-terminal domain/subunit
MFIKQGIKPFDKKYGWQVQPCNGEEAEYMTEAFETNWILRSEKTLTR